MSVAVAAITLQGERVRNVLVDGCPVGVGEQWVLPTDGREDAFGDSGGEDGVVADTSSRSSGCANVDTTNQATRVADYS